MGSILSPGGSELMRSSTAPFLSLTVRPVTSCAPVLRSSRLKVISPGCSSSFAFAVTDTSNVSASWVSAGWATSTDTMLEAAV